MIHFLDPLRDIEFTSLVARLFLAVLCGTLIGLERSAKNRAAGFRTHILVCLGAAVTAVTGHYIYLGLRIPADITRLSGQVITGLGFIGAGTIIVTKNLTIKGLTTAAGLWTTGIIGLALGSGFYEGGLLGTILVLVIQIVLAPLSHRIQRDADFTIEILYNEKDSLDRVMRFCKDKRSSIKNLQIHSHSDGPSEYSAILKLRSEKRKEMILSEIRVMPGIVAVYEV